MIKPQPGDETYYTKGKDADWFAGLDDQTFAWEAKKTAMDIVDGNFACIEDWIPIAAIVDSAADRIKRQNWNDDLTKATPAAHVMACYFDQTVGEWVVGVVMSPPSAPWTHWRDIGPMPDNQPVDDDDGSITVAIPQL